MSRQSVWRRRASVLAIVVVASAFAHTGTAAAQQYPFSNGPLDVGPDGNTGVVAPGEAITISGGGYAPGAEVTIIIESDPIVLGTTRANAAGRFSLTVRIPAGLPAGEHRLTAVGPGPDGELRVLTRSVEVTGTPSPPPLAFTGASTFVLAIIGAALLLTGLGLRHVVNRRTLV